MLELEYFEALPPPAPLTSFKQDDWISAAHANVEGYVQDIDNVYKDIDNI